MSNKSKRIVHHYADFLKENGIDVEANQSLLFGYLNSLLYEAQVMVDLVDAVTEVVKRGEEFDLEAYYNSHL